MMTQFNNCGNYAEVAGANASSSSILCDEDCVTPVVENLSLKANMRGQGTEFQVPIAMSEFNIGGDCNEAGYVAYNSIRWELQLNGVTVRNSGMAGLVSGGPAHSKCVNGRFLVYVNLASIPEDPVNRGGLRYINGNNARAAYDLYIEIYGQETATSAPVRNIQKGRSRISLLAI